MIESLKFLPIERAHSCWSVGYMVQTKGNFLTTHYVTHIADGHQDAEYYANLFAKAPEMLDILKRLVSGLSDNGVPYDIVEAINIIKALEESK
jgi:hypothetical protein